MEQVNNEKIYFAPGDVVTVDKAIDNTPKMYVIRKEVSLIKGESKPNFLGIRCRWFDKNFGIHEAIFDTKDLKLINN